MAGAKLQVVADSIAIRESVRVALEARYALGWMTRDEAQSAPAVLTHADLVIAEVGAGVPSAAPRVLWIASAPSPSNPPPVLAFPFRPEHLRLAVERALASSPTARASFSLAPPLISAGAAATADAAARCRLPVLICGERGTGKHRLARQIHERSGGGPFVAVPAARLAAALCGPQRAEPATLLIPAVERIDEPAAEALRAFFLDAARTDRERAERPRIIAVSTVDPDALAVSGALDDDVLGELTVLTIHLLPLRERAADLPAIATAALAHSAARHAIDPPPRLSAGALARLCRYPWPGNLIEIEAVLTRSALLRTRPELDAGDLVFDIADAAPRPAAGPPSVAADTAGAQNEAAGAAVARLLHELAHELKNPMVAIKTAAQQMTRASAATADQRDIARLAGDAVDRMDRVVENMLQFARFDGVRRTCVPLGDLLGPAIEALHEEFEAHQIQLDDRTDEATSVWVDERQIAFALENLLHAAVRAAGSAAPLALRNDPAATLLIEFPANTASVTAALSRWSDGPLLGPLLEPSIPFVFARELIERNGGGLAVRVRDGTTTIRVTLPRTPEDVEEAGA